MWTRFRTRRRMARFDPSLARIGGGGKIRPPAGGLIQGVSAPRNGVGLVRRGRFGFRSVSRRERPGGSSSRRSRERISATDGEADREGSAPQFPRTTPLRLPERCPTMRRPRDGRRPVLRAGGELADGRVGGAGWPALCDSLLPDGARSSVGSDRGRRRPPVRVRPGGADRPGTVRVLPGRRRSVSAGIPPRAPLHDVQPAVRTTLQHGRAASMEMPAHGKTLLGTQWRQEVETGRGRGRDRVGTGWGGG